METHYDLPLPVRNVSILAPLEASFNVLTLSGSNRTSRGKTSQEKTLRTFLTEISSCPHKLPPLLRFPTHLAIRTLIWIMRISVGHPGEAAPGAGSVSGNVPPSSKVSPVHASKSMS